MLDNNEVFELSVLVYKQYECTPIRGGSVIAYQEATYEPFEFNSEGIQGFTEYVAYLPAGNYRLVASGFPGCHDQEVPSIEVGPDCDNSY